jgi:hypothetical protein
LVYPGHLSTYAFGRKHPGIQTDMIISGGGVHVIADHLRIIGDYHAVDFRRFDSDGQSGAAN